jgi:transcriptional regulator with XRE-family HTH domain
MKRQRLVNRFQELVAVKERREGRRISQRTAAEEMGLTQVTIGRYSRNELSRYDESIVLAMCNYLGCTVGELLVIEEFEEAGGESPEIKTPLAVA